MRRPPATDARHGRIRAAGHHGRVRAAAHAGQVIAATTLVLLVLLLPLLAEAP